MEAAAGGVVETDSDKREDREDERVGRCGEQDAGLAHAAQVSCEQHGDHADSDRDGGGGE